MKSLTGHVKQFSCWLYESTVMKEVKLAAKHQTTVSFILKGQYVVLEKKSKNCTIYKNNDFLFFFLSRD